MNHYGSNDCSVKLDDLVQFELGETCCDTSTMNCGKIVGIGERFSNNNELKYELTLYLSDGKKVRKTFLNNLIFKKHLNPPKKPQKDKLVPGIVEVVSSTRIEIPFPYGFMPNIKHDHVIITLGISYGMTGYSVRNMTYYDSKCRSCSNGVLDENLVGY